MLQKYFLIIDRCAANYRQLYPAPFNLTKFLSGQNEIWFHSAASTGGAKRDEAGFCAAFGSLEELRVTSCCVCVTGQASIFVSVSVVFVLFVNCDQLKVLAMIIPRVMLRNICHASKMFNCCVAAQMYRVCVLLHFAERASGCLAFLMVSPGCLKVRTQVSVLRTSCSCS